MAITGRYYTTDKPTFMGNNNEFKDWTTDPKKGDKFYTGEGSGQGWYPIWRTESEMAALPLQKFSEELSNPNSKYYKDYSDRLKRTLSAGTSTESWRAGLVTSVGTGLTIASNVLKVNAGYFGTGLAESGGQIVVNYDSSSLEISTALLKVKGGFGESSSSDLFVATSSGGAVTKNLDYVPLTINGVTFNVLLKT